MSTIRESILARLKGTTLAGTTSVGARVFRSRADKFTPEEAPALNVRADSETPTENAIGKVDADLRVEVQVYQRGTEPDRLADPIVEDVHARMMSDTTLGGLAFDITEEGTSWDIDEADRTALLVRMRYVIRYRHNRNSLTS